VDTHPETAVPAQHDVVEVIDQITGYRVTAEVENACDSRCVLLFDVGAAVPLKARVHWDHGNLGWQAGAELESLDESRACFRMAPTSEWEPGPVRQSLRTPVDNFPILMRIVKSSVLPSGRCIHAVCLDFSDTGCRVSLPSPTPLVGDELELAWDVGNWHDEAEPDWIVAHVVRIVSMPFGGRQAGIRFDPTDARQASRVQSWSHAWRLEQRRRALARAGASQAHADRH
jgi:hypothetical protein